MAPNPDNNRRLVLLVAAAGEVIPALVAGQNTNDGTLNLIHVSTDKSKHGLLGSADFHHAIDRRFSIPHGLDKYNELQKFENAQAEKEGRDAKTINQYDVLAQAHDVWVNDDEVWTSTGDDGVERATTFYFNEDAVGPYFVPIPEDKNAGSQAPAQTEATATATAGSGGAAE
jgi:hypothetical protein